jgi:transcriptional regulator with XRE-family HTH domain
MGRASDALKRVLQEFDISQNQVAVALNVDRSAVYKWFHGQREPTSETIVELTRVLKAMKPEAASRFVQLYLGEILEEEEGEGKKEKG